MSCLKIRRCWSSRKAGRVRPPEKLDDWWRADRSYHRRDGRPWRAVRRDQADRSASGRTSSGRRSLPRPDRPTTSRSWRRWPSAGAATVVVVAADAFADTAVVGDNVSWMARNAGVTGDRHRWHGARSRRHRRYRPAGIRARHHAQFVRTSPAPAGSACRSWPAASRSSSGDVMVGDRDGVVVIPAAMLDQVLARLDRSGWPKQRCRPRSPAASPISKRWRRCWPRAVSDTSTDGWRVVALNATVLAARQVAQLPCTACGSSLTSTLCALPAKRAIGGGPRWGVGRAGGRARSHAVHEPRDRIEDAVTRNSRTAAGGNRQRSSCRRWRWRCSCACSSISRSISPPAR